MRSTSLWQVMGLTVDLFPVQTFRHRGDLFDTRRPLKHQRVIDKDSVLRNRTGPSAIFIHAHIELQDAKYRYTNKSSLKILQLFLSAVVLVTGRTHRWRVGCGMCARRKGGGCTGRVCEARRPRPPRRRSRAADSRLRPAAPAAPGSRDSSANSKVMSVSSLHVVLSTLSLSR